MLKIENVRHSYGSGGPVIHMPDIQCEKGSELLILGQSGAGKTTLLNLVGGLLRVQEGTLIINNQDLRKLEGSSLDRFRGKNIGIIFQKPPFVGSLNVLENILLAQKLSGMETDRDRATQLLAKLNIGHLANQLPDRLSVGEQQRANIARALINKPALVLADEPTSALDDSNCKEVVSLLKRAASDEGATLLIVTHDQRLKDEFGKHVLLTSSN